MCEHSLSPHNVAYSSQMSLVELSGVFEVDYGRANIHSYMYMLSVMVDNYWILM